MTNETELRAACEALLASEKTSKKQAALLLEGEANTYPFERNLFERELFKNGPAIARALLQLLEERGKASEDAELLDRNPPEAATMPPKL